jgi:acyl-CoA hydrolase
MLLGTRRHTNSCYVTYVALDRDGKPTEVPALVLETDADKRRSDAGRERRRRRVEERADERAKLDEVSRKKAK